MKLNVADKMKARFAKLEDEWAANVMCYADQVDPFDEEDWHSLKYGWGLAKGLQIDEAEIFAAQGER